MADTCVLGPGWQSHVVCRRWPGDVVLFRHGEQLLCRADGEFTIDGQSCRGKGELRGEARVEAEEFSFSLERLDEGSEPDSPNGSSLG